MMNNAWDWISMVFTVLLALGAVKFDHWLTSREKKRDLIDSLLEEIKANRLYLSAAKHVTLYDDAYVFAKNSGNIRILPLKTRKSVSALYVGIRNWNEWINRWSCSMGVIDWDNYIVQTKDDNLKFPEWLNRMKDKLLEALRKAEENLIGPKI